MLKVKNTIRDLNGLNASYLVLVLREFAVGPVGNVSLYNTFFYVGRFTRSLHGEPGVVVARTRHTDINIIYILITTLNPDC